MNTGAQARTAYKRQSLCAGKSFEYVISMVNTWEVLERLYFSVHFRHGFVYRLDHLICMGLCQCQGRRDDEGVGQIANQHA